MRRFVSGADGNANENVPGNSNAQPIPMEQSQTLMPLGALAAGFGLMLGSNIAAAQGTVPTPPAATPAEVTLPEIKAKAAAEEQAKEALQTRKSSIGKGQQEIRDIPQSLTVVTEKLIDDVKLDTLRQALHYTAGITFAATENGTDQDIRLRGFPIATTGDLLIDGMKDPSQYDRDTFNYDRIEVMRGSASMLFGRGSTGGVVNQVTKKPQLANVSDVMLTAGTGNTMRATADINVRLGETSALRINGMINQSDNYGAKIDKQGIAPTLSWGLGTGDEFSVGAFLLNVNNIPMNSIRYVGGTIASNIPAKNFYGTASDYVKGDATFVSGSWLHKFGDGNGEVRTQFRSGLFKRDTWITAAGLCSVPLNAQLACPTGSPAVTNDTLNGNTVVARAGLTPRKDDIRGTYFQSDYSNRFNWFGLRNDLLTGVDFAQESADRYGSYGAVGTNYAKGGTTVGTPNDGRITPAVPVYRATSDYSGKAMGAYVQDLVWLNPQWKVLAGVRFDSFKADMHQISYSNAAGANPLVPTGIASSTLSYPSLWSYRTGLLYQPTATQSYHLSYGTSFNTSADTYQYTTQATANVPAEKSRNIELGAKLDWLDGQLSTRAAIFRTEKYNERTTDADVANPAPGAPGITVLSGKRHTQGVEFDVVGRITRKLEIYLSYSHFTQAKIDQVGTAGTGAGSPVGLTPKNSGAVWLSYQAMPKLRIAGGARGASQNRPLQGGNGAASTTAYVPGYVAYDAMLEYTISPDLFAQVNVINVGNLVYGDQLYPAFYVPGEARSVKLTLGMRF